MKIRHGFVSNSSSSSFIVGIVRMKDVPEEHKDKFKPFTMNDREEVGYWFTYDRDSNKLQFDLEFYGMSCSNNFYTYVEPDEKLGVYYTFGSDDNDFWNGDEYNYDLAMDRSFFSEEEQEMMELIESFGGEVAHGAGRDG